MVLTIKTGAWLMTHEGQHLSTNPFYALMPDWFLLIGIGIATLAAIIASQALISGSFTLVSEAVRLNFWPKVRLLFPSEVRGQLFVPAVNVMLWIGCIGVVRYFKESHATGNFTFIVMQKFLSFENNLPPYRRVIMQLHFLLTKISINEKRWFGLDDNNVEVEKIPLLISPAPEVELKRLS